MRPRLEIYSSWEKKGLRPVLTREDIAILTERFVTSNNAGRNYCLEIVNRDSVMATEECSRAEVNKC